MHLFGRRSLPHARQIGEDDARSMSLLQDALQRARRLVVEKIKVLTAQPPPSKFGVPKIAEVCQRGQRPIHCLRPRNRRGVPLTMLHDVFLSFARDAGREPGTAETFAHDAAWTADVFNKAQTAAEELCWRMGDFYKTEAQRRDRFNKTTNALFTWHTEYEMTTKSELHGGKIDTCSYTPSGQMLVIGEVELESGSTPADAYLQACRVYQILVSKLRDQGSPLVAEGIPAFILTLVGKCSMWPHVCSLLTNLRLGPQLTVCGGFWDGEHEIIEPLAPPCLMLPDFGGPREQQLARQLYWLKAGVVSLSESQSAH